jgi:hypothetical protein
MDFLGLADAHLGADLACLRLFVAEELRISAPFSSLSVAQVWQKM